MILIYRVFVSMDAVYMARGSVFAPFKWYACLHYLLHLDSVQIPSLDLSHLTLLYALNYVALLKHFSTTLCTTALTTFSSGNAFSSSIVI